jgi:ADP-ribosyl-[dinitrogen reductase] hydrolase
VGLGGTINESLSAFMRDGTPLTRRGDASSSGNGSIMRLAPVACCFASDPAAAVAAARLQSRTTHAGDEAAECAALLASLLVRAFAAAGSGLSAQDVLSAAAADGFDTPSPGVACLARSAAEPGGDPNRDWNWRREDFRFSPARAAQQPGYVGSYAMDALAMALHCVWSTASAREALLLAVNHRGDADSVGAVTGQLAGALYGVRALPRAWVAAVQRWDGGGGVALRARHLFRRTLPRAMVATAEEEGA